MEDLDKNGDKVVDAGGNYLILIYYCISMNLKD